MLNNRDIVSMVGSASDMNDKCIQVIDPVRVLHVIHRVEESELKWKRDAVRQLDIFLKRFLILESLKMKRENVRKLLDLHPTIINRGKEQK